MPRYLNNVISQYDLDNLPVSTNVGDSNSEESAFYYFKGGDGGSLGKKSTLPRWSRSSIDLVNEEDQDKAIDYNGVIRKIKDSKYSNSIVNYEEDTRNSTEYGVFEGDQSDAGYAIKYVTGKEGYTYPSGPSGISGPYASHQMTSTVTFQYEPTIKTNLNIAAPDNSSWEVSKQGVNAQIVKRFSPYPYTGLAFHCEFSYNVSDGLITIDKVQEPDGTIFDMKLQYNYTGSHVYLSGSGLSPNFETSMRVFNIDRSGAYGYSDYKTSTSNINDSGVIFLCGSGGFLNDGSVQMHANDFGFIAAEKYSGHNHYYYRLPASGFIKFNPTDNRWFNMLNVYAIELDYDDRDRKFDPLLIGNGDIYYNTNITGAIDSDFDFYYNANTAPRDYDNTCTFPLMMMHQYSKSTPTGIAEIIKESKSFRLKLERKSKKINTVGDAFDVTEQKNKLTLVSDHFGFYTENQLYEEDGIGGAWGSPDEAFSSIEVQRGSFFEDYEYLPYDSYDRVKSRNKSKFMIIHHGYNASSNTFFWGVNGINKVITKFLLPDSWEGVATDGVYCPFLYFANYCTNNLINDNSQIDPLGASVTYNRKNIANTSAATPDEPYDCVKMNIYDIYSYVNIGDGSNTAIEEAVDVIYQNLKQKYSRKMIFGGASCPSTGEVGTYVSENVFHSEISASGIYYDGDANFNSPFYGKMQTITEDFI